MQQYGDNFIPVIPTDDIRHTTKRPFCFSDSCGCHEDPELIDPVNQAYQDGELTAEEATRYTQGRQV